MNNKVLIICETIYNGNTMKLASAMSVKLNCNVVNVSTARKMDLSSYDVIGLGSGIYFTAHHPDLIELTDKLNIGKKVFLFSTHGAPFLGKYHMPLKTALKERGAIIIGEFSCRGYDCTGPFNIYHGGNKGKPNENDQRRAQKFVNNIMPEHSKDTDKTSNGKHIEVDPEACTGCGQCVITCPMKVYEFNDVKPMIKSEQDCIHCSLCKSKCPEKAISINHSWIEMIQIAKRHSKRKSL